MDFPSIQMNFWDAVFAIPMIMVLTQFIKVYFKIPKWFVPTIAVLFGLGISIFISHKHSLISGLFMGWFYGYAAIGSYASLKTNIVAYRNKKSDKY
ncbi:MULTISPECIES: hypothetical protein [Bacillaceae]|uniref:hypothetical protein n=1 Tax=Bacillaceae TaxID=186817 RepID=UPI002FFEECA5